MNYQNLEPGQTRSGVKDQCKSSTLIQYTGSTQQSDFSVIQLTFTTTKQKFQQNNKL